ncbi:SMP-30/gluconolactonase/LRE family protein [Roseateles koreensis]|uniref:SMP-30/gluconolactonase/LRE family protein n=1 Tax=Roseateles koreensis TaxID=2987526 RepID=A0ABT5KVL4_9BURK|nr:SMP-30/gluconolactonase/LRE family protein [Roseateles koreensis]MDC8786826.1 SMP-30/gluconolactonase/LRE family protein [Roseateles koreensis]
MTTDIGVANRSTGERGEEALLALAQGAILGEGLQWHEASQRWWWTDIQAATLHAWTPGSAQVLTARLPDRLGSFAHCRSGRLLLGLAKRLVMASLPDLQASGSVTPGIQSLVPVDPAEPRTRINDGRTDRRGFFVFGTMNETAAERRPIGSFYQYSRQYGLRRLALPAVAIANSICFSPDGRRMYFCDTLTQRIMQCSYDAETAQVADLRVFVQLDDPKAWPDGSVIDADGCLWNAQWGAGQVLQYSPEGERMRTVAMAASQVTCPAFGGDQMGTLMVSSARENLSREHLEQEPLAGSLFACQVPGLRGLADCLFDDLDESTAP